MLKLYKIIKHTNKIKHNNELNKHYKIIKHANKINHNNELNKHYWEKINYKNWVNHE